MTCQELADALTAAQNSLANHQSILRNLNAAAQLQMAACKVADPTGPLGDLTLQVIAFRVSQLLASGATQNSPAIIAYGILTGILGTIQQTNLQIAGDNSQIQSIQTQRQMQGC
jgi:hypothetical protein